jgi:hypothetical protein
MCGTLAWRCEHCSMVQQSHYMCPPARSTTISCSSSIPLSLSNPAITLPICNYCGNQHRSRPIGNVLSYQYNTESENKPQAYPPNPIKKPQPRSSPSATYTDLKQPHPPSNPSTTSDDVQVPPANDPFWIKPSQRLPDNDATLKKYNATREDILTSIESKQDTKPTSTADGASTQEQSVTDEAWRKLIDQIRRA